MRVRITTRQVKPIADVHLADNERIVGAWPKFTSENGGTNWIVLAIEQVIR